MRLFIFSLLLLLAAPDRAQTDSLPESKYQQRISRYQSVWHSLIPTQFIIQNAGNMGLVSLGIGWNYGRHEQWETHWMVGRIPKYKSSRGKMTMTIKETFVPWRCNLGKDWALEPLATGLYLNAVFGHEFWKSQPNRYPDSYYEFMSTKFRLNVFFGERITKQIPNSRRKFVKSVSAFYEISTCDLYIRAKFLDHDVRLSDIVGLSLGLKLQVM